MGGEEQETAPGAPEPEAGGPVTAEPEASPVVEAAPAPAEAVPVEPEAAASPPARRTTAEEDAHALLGPDVRTPVGIPKQYRPNEVSIHALLRVELTDFVGPLDLLLFLIREHDLDVLDIPIAFITERYLAMLDTLESLPIDVAAEFLVMAAELAHIKSKMLLPPEEGVAVEVEDSPESGDPRADLVRRLLEYQKYRDAARQLDSSAQLGRDVFTRGQVVPEAMEDLEPGPGDFSIFRLVEAMADVLSRLTPEKQHEVIADTVTITERIELILAFGEARGMRFPFVDLFAGMESRRVVVMTFLALLEMARTGMLRIEQEPEQAVVELEARAAEAPEERPTDAPAIDERATDAPPAADVPAEDAPAIEERVTDAPPPTDGPPPADVPPPADAPPPADTPPPRARITAADVEAAYDEAERAFDEPRVRTVRAVSELPPLVAPTPGALVLVLTGKRAGLGEGEGGVRDDYGG